MTRMVPAIVVLSESDLERLLADTSFVSTRETIEAIINNPESPFGAACRRNGWTAEMLLLGQMLTVGS